MKDMLKGLISYTLIGASFGVGYMGGILIGEKMSILVNEQISKKQEEKDKVDKIK